MRAISLFVGACLLAAVLPGFIVHAGSPAGQPGSNPAVDAVHGATRDVALRALQAIHFRDGPLTQQPLTALEARFASNFPGTIARFRAGDATVIVRRVTTPTRKLHPAADCFRAAGYSLGAVLTYADAAQARWNCFEATQDGRRWRVCERISDPSGKQWTDVSSWYWAALWSQRNANAGPWWAVTLVTPLTGEDDS